MKHYRERTGATLKEAVDAIEALGRGERIQKPNENATGDDQEIVSLLQAGKKIAAIKLYRDKTGSGLASAKAAVEPWRASAAFTSRGAAAQALSWPAP